MKSVYIVDGSMAYRNLFESMGFQITKLVGSASLICFTGGEDVSPILYGAQAHNRTFYNVERDEYELGVFEQARRADIPMVGICRGGQFLNCASGGAMYQDVTGHTQEHWITDVSTGQEVWVSSTHHQMIKPSKKGLLVAFSTIPSTREWFEGNIFKRDESNTGNEVVWYEHTKSLCFQPHPEFNAPHHQQMREYFSSLLSRFIFKE